MTDGKDSEEVKKADSVDSSSKEKSPTGNPLVPIAATVVTALAFNWLSDLWAPTAPVVLLFAVVGLALLSYGDLSKISRMHGLGWLQNAKEEKLVELILAALLVGALFGGISIIPLFPTTIINSWPGGANFRYGSDFHNYEVGAVSGVIIMVVISYYRKPNLRLQVAFWISAVFGIAMAYDLFRPGENDFSTTFFGWVVAGGIAALFLTMVPRMFAVLMSFLGIKGN